MSGPPPPPAPPGGSFTSRQATSPTAGARTSPTPNNASGKAPVAAAASTKSATPPARGQSPSKLPPAPASSATGKQPVVNPNNAAAGKSSPARGATPPAAPGAGRTPTPTKQQSSAPQTAPATGSKTAPPAPGRTATPPRQPATPAGQTAAPAPPPPPGGKATPPRNSASTPTTTGTPPRGGTPAKKVPAAAGQPPLPPGRQPSPKKAESPPPPPSNSAEPAAAAATPNASAGPDAATVPPVARKSPAGKKSPARAGGKPSAAPAATPAVPEAELTPPPPATYTRGTPSAAPGTPATDARRGDVTGVSPIPPDFGSPPPLSMGGPNGPSSTSRRPTHLGYRASGVAAAPRITAATLDRDPRSGLPLIVLPADRKKMFEHLGEDIILHFFEDTDRISSKGKALRRTVLITDQTLCVCETNGSLMRCVQVSKISQVNVATNNSNEIALVIPSEYDIILRFDRRSQRDDALTVLRAVHKRMLSTELAVWHVKDTTAAQYRMEKPPGFQLQRIPQRSRANLAKALESIDASDRERRIAIQRVQEDLDFEHKQELLDKQQEVSVVQSKLDEAAARRRAQPEEMERLRQVYNKIQRRVEEIDAQYPANAAQSMDLTVGKDMKIRELNEVVEMLTASVTKANEERLRAEKLQRSGDFEQRDLDFVESDIPRLRGRSLQHQGLVEVLQRQLMEKQRELADLQSRQVDLQKLTLDLRRKEEQLKELEQTIVTGSSNFRDPNAVFSSAATQSTFEELLSGAPPSSPRGGGSGSPRSGDFGSPSTMMDDIARHQQFQQRNGGRGGQPGGSTNDSVLLGRGALSPPKQLFSSDLPEFRVPADEKDFKEDPRTGLRFKDLEGPFVERFPSLQGAIMFFFAIGTKENKRGQSQKRVLIVTDQVVYQCTTGGAINRTFEIQHVREFRRDRDNQVALVVEGQSEYDLLMRFKDSPDVVQELQEVMVKTSAYNKRTPPLVVKEIERIAPTDLRLEKPPSWEYVDRRARPRRGLYRALQQLSKTSASERMRANAEQDELRRDLSNRIREDLMPEVNLRREREFIKLRQQLTLMQQTLQDRQAEARKLLGAMQSHKCTISGAKAKDLFASHDFFESGSYWIPTDPVVMEAQMEILHIAFHNNNIVTSHPNGFLNLWDVTSAEPLRTLKINGHTARVTTFHFNLDLILSGGHDSSLRLWEVKRPAPVFVVHNAHKGAVTCVQFEGSTAVSSGTDGVLHVWDFTPTSLKPRNSLRAHKSTIVGFKMQGGFIASAEWGWIFLWDLAKGIVIRTMRDDNGGIRCIDLSGTRIVTGGTSGVLNVWSTTSGVCTTMPGHADDIHNVALQGRFVVSSSADGSVRVWDASDGGVALGVFHECFPQEVKSFHFMANRFVLGEGTTIKCWTR